MWKWWKKSSTGVHTPYFYSYISYLFYFCATNSSSYLEYHVCVFVMIWILPCISHEIIILLIHGSRTRPIDKRFVVDISHRCIIKTSAPHCYWICAFQYRCIIWLNSGLIYPRLVNSLRNLIKCALSCGSDLMKCWYFLVSQ